MQSIRHSLAPVVMNLVGLDLGGTNLVGATFSREGEMDQRQKWALGEREGEDVGRLLRELLRELAQEEGVDAVGVSVPGIYRPDSGRVWAPNIPGWDDYPLREELEAAEGIEAPVRIDSDRSCYILGETWKGTARGCRDAIFLAVGTGIGAGILVDGQVLRGSRGSAGAAGWMAVDRPFRTPYETYGCLEYHASGEGLARVVRDLLEETPSYRGPLRSMSPEDLTGKDVFAAFREDDPVARQAIDRAVAFWGMAVANLISLFDPEVVVLGGGVFGPALELQDRIREEAERWAQPISVQETRIEGSSLGGDAGLYGAASLARTASSESP